MFSLVESRPDPHRDMKLSGLGESDRCPIRPQGIETVAGLQLLLKPGEFRQVFQPERV